jgi:small subunit ribosomal protein S1
MNNNFFMPEGTILYTQENLSYISNLSGLERAMRENKTLEGRVTMCDNDLNLHVDLCGIEGIIPKNECILVANGETVKDIAIITRVGKPVCFKVVSIEQRDDTFCAILSRRAAQIECKNYYLASLVSGDIIDATVTHLDTFGAFVDIGCGNISLLSIDCISVSRISHPSDRLFVGQKLKVVVKSNDIENGRIYVTLKELLGTWEENARFFSVGQTVSGIVRSIESYGVFIELSSNLAGLAELRDDHHAFYNLEIGDSVSVYIKSIIPEKMKIKLVLIDMAEATPPKPIKYFVDTNKIQHMDIWHYSPTNCTKTIETVFD